jgi:hypothetical protein
MVAVLVAGVGRASAQSAADRVLETGTVGDDGLPLLTLAETAIELGNQPVARKILVRIEKVSLNQGSGNWLVARSAPLYARMGDRAEVDRLRGLLAPKWTPDNVLADSERRELAIAYEELGDEAAADALLAASTNPQPGWQAEVAARKGKLDRARKLAGANASTDTLVALAVASATAGDRPVALAYLDEAEKNESALPAACLISAVRDRWVLGPAATARLAIADSAGARRLAERALTSARTSPATSSCALAEIAATFEAAGDPARAAEVWTLFATVSRGPFHARKLAEHHRPGARDALVASEKELIAVRKGKDASDFDRQLSDAWWIDLAIGFAAIGELPHALQLAARASAPHRVIPALAEIARLAHEQKLPRTPKLDPALRTLSRALRP